PEHGVHFRAQLFDENGQAKKIALDTYKWTVLPAELGRISDDGYFIAGKKPGRGKVLTTLAFEGKRYVGEADVWIGRSEMPDYKVNIQPELAVVPPKDTLKYNVSVISTSNRVVKIKNIRWDLYPKELGTINSRGIFVAGPKIMEGIVIAHVEIDGQVLKGEARVIVAPRPSAKITGKVTDSANGTPIKKAYIWAQRVGNVRWHDRAMTDENGEYTLKHLIPGLYTIHAVGHSYIGEWYDDVRNYREAKPVEVTAKNSVGNIDFTLDPGASIAGAVIVENDKSPLKGVHIVAHLVVNPAIKYHAVTDEKGEYLIEGLASGTFRVMAEKEGYKAEWYDNKPRPELADLVVVEEPKTTEGINFVLATATAITGVVKDVKTGEPIPGARVYAKYWMTNIFSPREVFESRANKNGEYIIQVLRAGNYLVVAEAKGYLTEMYKDAYRLQDADAVKVIENEHTTDIDFDLVMLGGMTGLVTAGATGEPIEGAVVEAFLEGPKNSRILNPVYRTRTDSDGVYIFKAMKAGKYLVQAAAKDFLPEFYENAASISEAKFVTVKDSTLTKKIDFSLKSGGIISGIVKSAEDSKPVFKSVVYVQKVRSNVVIHTYTNEEGKFKVEGLPSGEYIAWANARGFHSLFYDSVKYLKEATKIKVVAPDETPDINFNLPPIKNVEGVIAGQVMKLNLDTLTAAAIPTEPIEGAWVIALPIQRNIPAGMPHWTVTDEKGEYKLTHLKPGKYVIATWAKGFMGEFYDDVRHWQKAKPVVVETDLITGNVDFILDIVPAGAYEIAGRVTNGAGEGVDEAMVYAISDSGVTGFAVTDAEGYYNLDNLMPGDYKLEVSRVDYTDGYYGGSDLNSAKTITVGETQVATNTDIKLGAVTAVENENYSNSIPTHFELEQNYPNPFNPTTNIHYQVPLNSKIIIKVYNILGQDIRTLVDKHQEAGNYLIQWDGKDENGNLVPSGLYFYQMKAISNEGIDFQKITKMSLIK
ncbi:carboxypeptidase regulatory-like domain-containing protein, partial [candidate division KSB1 bacterium]|nr:carboxypeptidase regulatory-like domain-containing protein [candidate division KSB1 bacterium]